MRCIILSFAFLFHVLTVEGKGRGGGGGGGGSSSSGSSSSGGSGLRSTYYYSDECYTALNPTPIQLSPNKSTNTQTNDWYIYKYDDKYRMNNSRNFIQSQVYADPPSPYFNTNWNMDIFDVYYNGSFSLTLTPNTKNATYASCPTITSGTIPGYYLRVGAQSRDNITRKLYDSNPFYFAFGLTIKDQVCPQTPNKLFAALESSNDFMNNTRVWDLFAKKSGSDKFDLAGSLTSEHASWNNYYNYLVNETGADISYANVNKSCPRWFNDKTLTAMNHAAMQASIDAGTATMTWNFTDSIYGYIISGEFHGTAWDKGAKLDTSGSNIATTGASKRVAIWVYKPKGFDWWNNVIKYVVIGVVLIGVGMTSYLVWKHGCFCCCCKRKAKKQAYDPVTQPAPPQYGGPQQQYGGQQHGGQGYGGPEQDAAWAMHPYLNKQMATEQSYPLHGGKNAYRPGY